MDTLTLWQLAALAAASTLVGFSKTAVSGAKTISLAVFAAVLPARESTGVLLPILIAGDALAVFAYRRHAHWPTLLRLFPAVAVGVVMGTVFMMWADDDAVRTSIGAILLFMAGVTVWRRRTGADSKVAPDEPGGPSGAGRLKARSYGVLGGFTTMVANAGGPVMSLHLLSAGFRKLGFLGTSAWFFLIVNTSKVPFSVGLGLIDAQSLLLDAAMLLFVVPGAYVGRKVWTGSTRSSSSDWCSVRPCSADSSCCCADRTPWNDETLLDRTVQEGLRRNLRRAWTPSCQMMSAAISACSRAFPYADGVL